METQFRQKRSLYKTHFDFGESELTYSFDNSRAKVGGTIAYHKIPRRVSYREIRIWWLRYVAVFTLTFCAVAMLHYWEADNLARLELVAFVAVLEFVCVCLLTLLLRRPGLTSIPLDPVLFVLHDGQQERILEEIWKRRLEAMRKKLSVVDFNRPYFEEARKFKWLKEDGVIGEQEYRNACQKIAALRDKAGLPPPPPEKIN